MASVLRKLTGVLYSRITQPFAALKCPRGHPNSSSYLSHAVSSGGMFRRLSTSPFGMIIRVPGISSSLQQASLVSSQLFQMVRCLPVSMTQVRNYKVQLMPKKRCKSCYFVTRQNRLFIECKASPRHKQMQLMSKHKLWREDYSKGDIVKAIYWKYGEKRYYQLGNNEFSRYDWLKGKIGVTV